MKKLRVKIAFHPFEVGQIIDVLPELKDTLISEGWCVDANEAVEADAIDNDEPIGEDVVEPTGETENIVAPKKGKRATK